MPAVRHTLARVIEILFPPRKTERLFLATPLATYQELVRPRSIEGTEALLPYSDPRVSALIWELKYKDSRQAAQIAGQLLAEHLVGALAEEMAHQILLVPIPLHRVRERERGYNQSKRITQEILPFLHGHAVFLPQALVRISNTTRQTTLKRTMRLRNVAGAFTSEQQSVAGRTCILVDDVITTGATMDEARKTLLRAGAARVISIALAYA